MNKNVTSALLLLLWASSAFAGDPKKYGEDMTVKELTKISDILAHPELYSGKRVKVEGTVLDVCMMSGCWIRIAGDKGSESVRFKVEDGVIEFPGEAKGQIAVGEGIVSVKTLSIDDQIRQGKHLAEEEGKTFDPKAVQGPKVAVQINGKGAELR